MRAVPTQLKIAMIAPPWYEVPPTGYGGIEAMIAGLVDGLVGRGHDIVLIGSGSDRTTARFLQTYATLPEPNGNACSELAQAAITAELLDRAVRSGERFDLVHDHSLAGPLLARDRDIPTIMTMHLPPKGDLLTYVRALGTTIAPVAISSAQRRSAPDLPWIATVPHGIDVATFPYQKVKDEVVCFLGRFSPEKGAHLAIDAARAAGLPIVLAGKCSEDREHAYFETEIAPRLGPDVVYIGVADFETKCELLAQSRCLVFPVLWDEPFGLVLLEAMACGTPVIALARGAVPEIVVDGVTGLVLSDPEPSGGLAEAIRQSKHLDPAACRQHVERHFAVDVMVREYEGVYRRALHQTPPLHQTP